MLPLQGSTLVDPVVHIILILQTAANVCFKFVCVSLVLNSFYNTALSDKKKVSLFNLLFQIQLENQSASLP